MRAAQDRPLLVPCSGRLLHVAPEKEGPQWTEEGRVRERDCMTMDVEGVKMEHYELQDTVQHTTSKWCDRDPSTIERLEGTGQAPLSGHGTMSACIARIAGSETTIGALGPVHAVEDPAIPEAIGIAARLVRAPETV